MITHSRYCRKYLVLAKYTNAKRDTCCTCRRAYTKSYAMKYVSITIIYRNKFTVPISISNCKQNYFKVVLEKNYKVFWIQFLKWLIPLSFWKRYKKLTFCFSFCYLRFQYSCRFISISIGGILHPCWFKTSISNLHREMYGYIKEQLFWHFFMNNLSIVSTKMTRSCQWRERKQRTRQERTMEMLCSVSLH